MSERIVTYHSVNARAGLEWVAYIDLGSDYLGIRFSGATEADAARKAREFWEADRAKREQAKANREAARSARAAKAGAQ